MGIDVPFTDRSVTGIDKGKLTNKKRVVKYATAAVALAALKGGVVQQALGGGLNQAIPNPISAISAIRGNDQKPPARNAIQGPIVQSSAQTNQEVKKVEQTQPVQKVEQVQPVIQIVVTSPDQAAKILQTAQVIKSSEAPRPTSPASELAGGQAKSPTPSAVAKTGGK